MKFLIPTAKEMKPSQAVQASPINDKTQAIIELMAAKNPDELAKLYKISTTAAQKEYDRWQALADKQAPHYPAIQLFNGLMYRQINRSEHQTYLDQHVLITSSLYGVIPASHPIAEHRLDFQPAVKIDQQSLKTYWRADFDRTVQNDEVLISLLSSEFEDVFSPEVRKGLITVSFHEEKEGKLKTHSTISKKGRGLLLNQAAKENAKTVADLKTLTFAGFSYHDNLSTSKKLVFVRQAD